MKRILVPCDFSVPAVQAYLMATHIAAKGNGEIFVVHAIDLPMMYETAYGIPPYVFDPSLLDTIDEQAKENFNKMQASTGEKASKVSFEAINGTVNSTILDYIESKAIDLVVMGTHGTSGLKEFFVGSNTEKIVRLSPVPVLSIRTASEVDSIKNIVLPSSLQLNQQKFIDKVKELQSFFGAKLHVLLVNTPARFTLDMEARELLGKFASNYKLENYTLNIRNDHFEENGIHHFIKEINADMVAMATHGRRGLAHLLSGSIAEDVMNHIECPIWTYGLRS